MWNKLVYINATVLLLAIYITAQSGDDYNTTTERATTETSLLFYEDFPMSLNISEVNIDDWPKIDRERMLLDPPCLLPRNKMKSRNSPHHRHTEHNDREVLNSTELNSDKVRLAGLLATTSYMEKHPDSALELVQYLGGCKQVIAGELLYLIFHAREVFPCQHSNCTKDYTAFDRECRARIHLSNFAPWNPFYVSCNSPFYYALPWRKLSA